MTVLNAELDVSDRCMEVTLAVSAGVGCCLRGMWNFPGAYGCHVIGRVVAFG